MNTYKRLILVSSLFTVLSGIAETTPQERLQGSKESVHFRNLIPHKFTIAASIGVVTGLLYLIRTYKLDNSKFPVWPTKPFVNE